MFSLYNYWNRPSLSPSLPTLIQVRRYFVSFSCYKFGIIISVEYKHNILLEFLTKVLKSKLYNELAVARDLKR